MESKIFNTTITIEGVEMKNNKLTLLAHDKKRYGFWMTKKDGSDSAPYLQFKSMELKQGDNVYIGYVLEPYTDARGVNREALKIINFRETNERPTQTAPQSQSPRSGQNIASGEVGNDAFGRRLAVHGLVNALLSNPQVITAQNMETMMSRVIEQSIKYEDEINKQLNPSKFRQAVQAHAPKITEPDLPVIQQDEPSLSDEDIPPF